MAAVGEQAIKTAAKYTDGLITLAKPDKSTETFEMFDKDERMKEKILTR
jgi:hypothetical protein